MPLPEHQVDAAADHRDVGLRTQRGHPPGDPVRVRPAVGVGEGHDLPADVGQGGVAGAVGTRDRFVQQPDPGVGRQHGGDVLGGGVVDDEDLDQVARVVLREEGLHAGAQEGGAVVHGDDDGDPREAPGETAGFGGVTGRLIGRGHGARMLRQVI